MFRCLKNSLSINFDWADFRLTGYFNICNVFNNSFVIFPGHTHLLFGQKRNPVMYVNFRYFRFDHSDTEFDKV